MTMETAEAPSDVDDTKLLLARVNERLVMWRVWLGHDHGDEPYWWARKTTPAKLQRERPSLRWYAHYLHSVRAASRGRIHSREFKTLEEQQAWLDGIRHAHDEVRAL